MIPEPMVRLAQTVQLSCTDTNIRLQTDQNKIRHDPRHLRVPSGATKMISKRMVRLAQIVHLSCTTLTPWSSVGCVQNDL
jgi:hypothetical protein